MLYRPTSSANTKSFFSRANFKTISILARLRTWEQLCGLIMSFETISLVDFPKNWLIILTWPVGLPGLITTMALTSHLSCNIIFNHCQDDRISLTHQMMGTRGECKPRVQDFNYCPQRWNFSIEGIPSQGSLVFPKKIVFISKNW